MGGGCICKDTAPVFFTGNDTENSFQLWAAAKMFYAGFRRYLLYVSVFI